MKLSAFAASLRQLPGCEQELDRLELKAELHQKLGGSDDLERAQEIVVQELLRRCPDQWSYYSSFLDLVEKRSGRFS